jgi:hypothetical protein
LILYYIFILYYSGRSVGIVRSQTQTMEFFFNSSSFHGVTLEPKWILWCPHPLVTVVICIYLPGYIFTWGCKINSEVQKNNLILLNILLNWNLLKQHFTIVGPRSKWWISGSYIQNVSNEHSWCIPLKIGQVTRDRLYKEQSCMYADDTKLVRHNGKGRFDIHWIEMPFTLPVEETHSSLAHRFIWTFKYIELNVLM